jgi:excisionase family DNA binding protein
MTSIGANVEQVFSTSQVAARLQVSPRTVLTWVQNGTLRGYRVTPGLPGSRWRVTESALREFEALRHGSGAGATRQTVTGNGTE